MASAKPMFTKITLGNLNLNHRVVMAPMTRIRADESSLAPTPLTAKYYAQRSTNGGLIISEAVHISPEATPIWSIYPTVAELGGQVPGIWTDEQTDAWKKVTNAVHAKGGYISCQLLHTGRVAQGDIANHPLVRGSDYPLPPVSSSAQTIKASDESGNQYNWDAPSDMPRVLDVADIRRIAEDYKKAATNALSAGFDMVELHAAHGYLVEQFLADGVNSRTDNYGGDVDKRCRFLFEMIEALIDVVGNNRLGVRLSPVFSNPECKQIYFGVEHSNPESLYECAVKGLNKYNLAYLLLTEPRVGGLSAYHNIPIDLPKLQNTRYRQIYEGKLIGAGGFTPSSAKEAVKINAYDLIAFGRWFLSNPDLVSRLRNGNDLNIYQRPSFYGGGERGYTDYPDLVTLQTDLSDKFEQVSQDSISTHTKFR